MIPEKCLAFWAQFSATQSQDPTPRFYMAFHFDDNERGATELARLVLDGTKRATASLPWAFEAEGVRLPQAGDLSIFTDFTGEPLGIIETTGVDVVPFEEVTAEFAATEGEGDRSLEYWRRGHAAYFTRECERLGKPYGPRIPVVCERFTLVHAQS